MQDVGPVITRQLYEARAAVDALEKDFPSMYSWKFARMLLTSKHHHWAEDMHSSLTSEYTNVALISALFATLAITGFVVDPDVVHKLVTKADWGADSHPDSQVTVSAHNHMLTSTVHRV